MTTIAQRLILILITGIALVATSCGGDVARQREQAAHYTAIDSIVAGISTIDSLAVLEAQWQQQGDLTGVMLASQRLGKLYRNNSRFEEAVNAHSRALDAALQLADTVEAVRASNNLGTDYRRMGQMERAMHCHYQALTLCDLMSDKTSDVAVKNHVISLNGLGNIFMTLENYELADSVLRAALNGEQRLGSDLGQAINYANLGAIHQHYGRTDSAWAYYRRSLELNTRAGSQLGIALCHNYFGSLLEEAGKLDSALAEYTVAHDRLASTDDRWHYLEACLSIARVKLEQGNTGDAATFINRSAGITAEIGSLEHEAVVEDLKHRLAASRGDNAGALAHYKRHIALMDSVQGNQNLNNLLKMRVNYERELRQMAIDSLHNEYTGDISRRNTALVIGTLILLLALAAISFLLYSLRLRARNQKLLEQMDRTRSDFFTNITHEFRTPLTVINGVADDIARTSDDPATVSRAAAISRQGNNLLALITQLLDISRVKNAIGNAEWRYGDIAAYLAMVVEDMQDMASRKNIELSYIRPDAGVKTDFVPYYVNRIVANLVSNAVKFTPEFGSITVSTRDTGGNVIITVADTGIGIKPDEVQHVFDPFFQAHDNDHIYGTGLGLPLVRQMAEAMGGSVAIESVVAGGTTITVKLPVRQTGYQPLDNDTAAATRRAATAGMMVQTPPEADEGWEPSDGNDSQRPRVLIVEDNADVARYVASQLEQLYDLTIVANGRDALARARQLIPDIIVTDLMMPGAIDGLALCRQVRASQVLGHIPIVVVSARSTSTDRIAGIEAGADAYLYKPFNADELRAVIANLLAQRQQLRERYTNPDAAPATTAIDAPPFASGDTSFIERFTGIVGSEMDRGAEGSLEVAHIARQLNMNPAQLRRKILALTGRNTTTFIADLRISRAKHLLTSQPELSIADVAVACGFADQGYFSRIFKQHEGIAPLQYRTKYEVKPLND